MGDYTENSAENGTNLGETLEQTVAALVHRHGPIPFAEVMRLALYDAERGFYAAGTGAAGRRGDFITSPEVGPLFGTLIGRALDNWWSALGRPDPFVVVEAGAGVGTLATSIAASRPGCAPALTYVLVEQSPVLRRRHGDHLALSVPEQALPPVIADDLDGSPATATGPRFVSMADLPAIGITGVVLCNELLDNLAFDLLERDRGSWSEIRVTADERGALSEQLVPASGESAALADRLAPRAPDGARLPLQHDAVAWLRRALDLVERGRVVVIDYGASTPDLAALPMTDWLRTYRGHERGGSPLEHLGRQDVTCEVCFDQLARVRAISHEVAQADFLRDLGIDELVAEGRRTWHERAHIGDLEAIRGRSRVNEAEALLDPSGLGAFRVVEWVLPA
jgi:SAM-dependent MidA family methyltransferase